MLSKPFRYPARPERRSIPSPNPYIPTPIPLPMKQAAHRTRLLTPSFFAKPQLSRRSSAGLLKRYTPWNEATSRFPAGELSILRQNSLRRWFLRLGRPWHFRPSQFMLTLDTTPHLFVAADPSLETPPKSTDSVDVFLQPRLRLVPAPGKQALREDLEPAQTPRPRKLPERSSWQHSFGTLADHALEH